MHVDLPSQEVERARRVYAAIKRLRLSSRPGADLEERLSLLTVAGRVRRVGGIGFAESGNEGLLRAVRDLLVNCGVRSRITDTPLHLTSHRTSEFSPEILAIFDGSDTSAWRSSDSKLLWVFLDAADVEEIRRSLTDDELLGTVLGYPECCVRRDIEIHQRAVKTFVGAILDAVGTDPHKVKQALEADLKVKVPGAICNDANIFHTHRLYPFLLYTVCDECLKSKDSQSARLNESYEQFALAVHEEFHCAIRDLAGLAVERGGILNMHTSEWKTRDELSSDDIRQLQKLDQQSEVVIRKLLQE